MDTCMETFATLINDIYELKQRLAKVWRGLV